MAKRLAAILCTVAMLLGCIASMTCAYADGEQTSTPDAAPTSQESPAADGTVPEATTDAALQAGGEETTPSSGEKTEEPTEPTQPTEEVIEPAPETNQAGSENNVETVSEEPAQPTEAEQPPVTEQEPPAAPEEPKVEEPAPEQPKTEEPAPEQPKTEKPAPEQPKEEKQEETPVEKPTDPVVSPDPEVEEPVQPAETSANPTEGEETPDEVEPLDPADESAVPGEETETPDETASDTPKSSEEETPEDPTDGEENQDDLQEPGTEPEAEEPAASPIIEVDGEQVELEIGSDPLTVIVKADAAGDVLLIAEKASDLKVSYNNKEVESAETENPDFVSFLISASDGENEVVLNAAQSGTFKIKAVKASVKTPENEEIAEEEQSETDSIAEESPVEEAPVRGIELHSTLDGLAEVEEGTTINMEVILIGVDPSEILNVTWMYSEDDGKTFHIMEDVNGLTYSYIVTPENVHNLWRVEVEI